MREEKLPPSPTLEEGSSDLLAVDFVARPKSVRVPNSLAPQGARPKFLTGTMASRKATTTNEPPPISNNKSNAGRGLKVCIRDSMNKYESIRTAPARNLRPLPSIPAVPPIPTEFVFSTPNTAPVGSTSEITSTPSSPQEGVPGFPSQPRKIRRLPKPPTSSSGHLSVPSFSSDMSGPPLEAGPSIVAQPCKQIKPLPTPSQPSSPIEAPQSRISRHIPTQSLPSFPHPDAEANALLSRPSTPPARLPRSLIPIAPLRPKSRIVSRIINTALRIPPFAATRAKIVASSKSSSGDGNTATAPPRPPTPPSPINSRARADRDQFGGIAKRRKPGAPLPLKHARSTLLLYQPIRFSVPSDNEDDEEEEEAEENSWSDESDDSSLEEMDHELEVATIVKAIPAFRAAVTSMSLMPGQRQTVMLTRHHLGAMEPTVMMPVPTVNVIAPPAPAPIDLDIKPSGGYHSNLNVNVNVEVKVKDEGEVDYKWILAERKLIRTSVRNSGKWICEKKGKRYTQRDYDQVMRVLRTL